jgi:hypothetical protein
MVFLWYFTASPGKISPSQHQLILAMAPWRHQDTVAIQGACYRWVAQNAAVNEHLEPEASVSRGLEGQIQVEGTWRLAPFSETSV